MPPASPVVVSVSSNGPLALPASALRVIVLVRVMPDRRLTLILPPVARSQGKLVTIRRTDPRGRVVLRAGFEEVILGVAGLPDAKGQNAMTIEPMLTEETPANVLVARVLQEAGIEMVFGISGGHTGRIVSGLSQYQNSVRTVLVREESLGGVMAEVYGRLTRRQGVLLGQGPWVLGNGPRDATSSSLIPATRKRLKPPAPSGMPSAA